MQQNHAPYYTNISELRKQPSKVIEDAQDDIVAIFNHNEIVSYMISPRVLEYLLEVKSDLEVLQRIEKMDLSQALDVGLDEL